MPSRACTSALSTSWDTVKMIRISERTLYGTLCGTVQYRTDLRYGTFRLQKRPRGPRKTAPPVYIAGTLDPTPGPPDQHIRKACCSHPTSPATAIARPHLAEWGRRLVQALTTRTRG